MDFAPTAKSIIEQVGGAPNIVSVTHCMTRLRFVLKDESIVNDAAVKAIDGVVGVMRKGGQYQIIIGNEVSTCYREIQKLGNFGDGSVKSAPKKKVNPVTAVLDAISGCMSPIIPAIIGAGIVKVLLIVLEYFVPADNQTMQLLDVIGDAAFYFLPVLVAFSAGRKFGANPMLTASVVAVLIHPDFISLLNSAADGEFVRFLGIPVSNTSYSSTVIPAILTAWVMSYIEKLVDKITPSFTKNFLKPALILLISSPIAFLLLGPLGSFIGNGLSAVLVFIQSHASVAAYVIMAAAMPFIVMTGMHWAFLPVTLPALETATGEGLMLPAMLISNVGLGAACLAVAVKTRDKKLKQLGASSGVSALFAGVTEPGLYGVLMPLRRPLIASCIASGATGLIAGTMNVTASSFASPSLLALPIFVNELKPGNIVMAIIVAAVSMVLSFLAVWFVGFKDPAAENDEGSSNKNSASEKVSEAKICSPLAGKVVELSEVNDPTFSEGILGKGAAVIPSDGKIYAPFDGKVEMLPDSHHALGLISNGGIELLIHVGLETVGLGGKGFTVHTSTGSSFKKGDLLLEADLDYITKSGCDTITPVIVSNTDDYAAVNAMPVTDVKPGDELISIE